MKILFIVDQTNLFGSELHLLDLLKNMSRDHKVQLLAFKDGPLIKIILEQKLSVSVKLLDISWFTGITAGFKIKEIIDNFLPDIIHSHQPKAIFYGSIYARLLKIKHISTIHSIPYGSASIHEGLKKLPVYWFHTFVQFTAELLSTTSIFLTHYNKHKYSFFKKKAVVIYNWLSDRFGADNKQCYIAQKGNKKIEFLAIGSLSKAKGFSDLLYSFNKLKNVDFHLSIVGSGKPDFENWMKDFILKNNLSDKISLLGYRKDLTSLYANADLFILLTHGETFGLVFIEAMHFALPVICSDIPQLKEIIPEENIFISKNSFIEPDILNKLKSQDFRNQVGLINKRRTEADYDYYKQINKVQQLYKSLLQDKINH